ncbi:MAG: hypothetical protein JXN59_16365 [Anaerolineae bacterium]|nr:hypothetical protein [Anaerolineae bacterium]
MIATPQFQIPAALEDWQARRAEIRARLLVDLLAFPPRPATPRVLELTRELRDGYTLKRLVLDNGAGATIPGCYLIPEGAGLLNLIRNDNTGIFPRQYPCTKQVMMSLFV